MKIIKYIKRSTRNFFKTRIGTDYKTKKHQYYSHWSSKTWFEDFE